MWALRILTGPQAGQIFVLQEGKNAIGRSAHCQVQLNSASISKEHAYILVTETGLILTDLNSRNGTFVNGVKIQHHRIEQEDKISLHDTIFDLIQTPENMYVLEPQPDVYDGSAQARPPSAPQMSSPPPKWIGNIAIQEDASSLLTAESHPANDLMGSVRPEANGGSSIQSIQDVFRLASAYLNNVAMPGIYGLVQSSSYFYALGVMVMLFIALVTALSTLPMIATTKKGIQQESVRRAKTIARHLAATNRQAVLSRQDLALSTRAAELEEGVTAALLISAKDGTILAPANKRGEFSSQPFVNQARREERETESFIDDSHLGVAVPISHYNPEIGGTSVAAYAMVLYDMGALAMTSSQVLSLFMQNFAIACMVGALLFFFLIKIVEHPISQLTDQLDEALRGGSGSHGDLETPYRFPVLKRLATNINVALSRISHSSEDGAHLKVVASRDTEASNIVRMLPIAAIAINAVDDRIIASNPEFDALIGGHLSLQEQPITAIPDPALQENINELLTRMKSSVSEVAMSEIPFFGTTYEVYGQAVMGQNEPVYFLIMISVMEDEVLG